MIPRVDCASTAKLDDDDDERANKKRVVVETTKRRREKEVFMMRDISGFVFIFDSIFFQFKTRKYTGLDLLFFFFFLLSDEMMVSDSKLDSDDQTFQIKTNLKLKIIKKIFFPPPNKPHQGSSIVAIFVHQQRQFHKVFATL